jgi:hypothetical protein
MSGPVTLPMFSMIMEFPVIITPLGMNDGAEDGSREGAEDGSREGVEEGRGLGSRLGTEEGAELVVGAFVGAGVLQYRRVSSQVRLFTFRNLIIRS